MDGRHLKPEKTTTMQKITCYLDESATDGGTPSAVVGGVVFNDSYFHAFDEAWRQLLGRHHLTPAFHMKDFKRNGRFASLGKRQRKLIFSEVVALVREYAILSLSSVLTVKDYNEVVDPFMQHNNGMSIYGACFLGCVSANVRLAADNEYDGPVHYMMDDGNQYRSQVQVSFDAFCDDPQWRIGRPLDFKRDEEVTALQAADLICWAARRHAVGGTFDGGFEPINNVLDSKNHAYHIITREDLAAISSEMVKWRDNLTVSETDGPKNDEVSSGEDQ
jgi:hypothetical protein